MRLRDISNERPRLGKARRLVKLEPSEELCRQLAEEKAPQRAVMLLSELQKWVDIEVDEIRLRVRALIKRYRKETENLEDDTPLLSESDDSHNRAA